MSRPGKAPTTAPRHTNGLSPGVWLARGNTHNHPSSHKGALARGMARPGKHPQPPLGTQRGSRPGYDSPGESTHIRPSEVLCLRGTQGFGNLPKDRPGLGETTYTTSESSLCTNGVLLPNTQIGRVSLLTQEVLPPHSGLCRYIGWPVETGHTIH